ncbi:MAG: GEVED domain-containing protein, partial [Bacteroidota bacterium]
MRTFLIFICFLLVSGHVLAQNVGIGTVNPTENLHLNGTFRLQDGSQQPGYVLTSDANGVASWQPAPNSAGVVGDVNAAGAVTYGAISATKTGVGTYEITFPTPFSNPPVVTLTPFRAALGGACAVTPCGTAPAQSTYCAPPYTDPCSTFISGIGTITYKIDAVTTSGGITNISDLSSTCSPSSYRQSVQTVQINPGGSFDMSVGVTSNSFYDTDGGFVHVFIDWNQDGDYDDAGEFVYDSGTPAFNHNFTVTAPCSAVCGTTRMRVRYDNNDNWDPTPGPGACVTYRLGETHDYNVEINSPITTAPGFCNVTGKTTTSATVECYDVGGNLQDAAFG